MLTQVRVRCPDVRDDDDNDAVVSMLYGGVDKWCKCRWWWWWPVVVVVATTRPRRRPRATQYPAANQHSSKYKLTASTAIRRKRQQIKYKASTASRTSGYGDGDERPDGQAASWYGINTAAASSCNDDDVQVDVRRVRCTGDQRFATIPEHDWAPSQTTTRRVR